MTLFLALALVAALVTFGGSVLVWKLSLKYRLYPKIRERDVHTRPTPRLGGIAMFLGILAAIGAAAFVSTLGSSQFSIVSIIFQNPSQMLAILGAALLIVLIGVADDIWDLDWMTKLAGQFLAAGLIAWQGVQISRCRSAASRSDPRWMSAHDHGVHDRARDERHQLHRRTRRARRGRRAHRQRRVLPLLLPAGAADVGRATTSTSRRSSRPCSIGACVGFLPLNWHPAKLFMGDAGALLSAC